jgi:uncharacterized membrane protein
MAFCEKCGTQLDAVTNICPACGSVPGNAGAPQGQASPFPGSAPQGSVGQQAPGQQGYIPFTQATSGTAAYADPNDVQENKVLAIVAYILFFIPLLTGTVKTSPFTKYHTNQGTLLFISAFIYGVAYSILTTVLAFIPILGWAMIALLGLLALIFPVFAILGIINAANGKLKPLPLIGGIQLLK